MARHFGEIENIKSGDVFANRRELHDAGIHRPLQAGISGSSTEGADSLVISGGYVDDEDYFDEVIYTGHGGRDINTGVQIADQELTNQNKALALNCINGLPVRVIRGSEHKSPHSPTTGYRYDGLYRVESYWHEKGRDGFNIWRFRLLREEPVLVREVEDEGANYATERKSATIQRIVRNTNTASRIKELYDYTCQVCDTRLLTSAGPYAEAAHIKPLGAPHNGPDIESNLLCLCPNHHVLFDTGAIYIDQNFNVQNRIEGKKVGRLTLHDSHSINLELVKYHEEHG